MTTRLGKGFQVSTPLVLQLQELASNNNTDVTELLRRALMVATKLKLEGLREWVNHELNGYGNEPPPEYRVVLAELKARNPYHGLIPFMIHDKNALKKICNVPLHSPIGALVDLINRPNDSGYLTLSIPARIKEYLIRIQDDYVQLEPVRTVGVNQIAAIIDVVRTKILNWSLELEAEGILGEGMTFSREEKDKARSVISIRNFQGVLGDVTNSTISQDLDFTVVRGDFQSLRDLLVKRGLTHTDLDKLECAIAEDPTPESTEKFGKNVSGWIGKMISKAAAGAWDITAGAAGGLLCDAIGRYYGLV